ncbi:hypothetical protein E1B28_008971 [Marasmius oreades]|uniref:Uncharacterized protein n=1 Tax=Marasmius oreades TaxID=181124 RepID=A0A9P7USN3_9AGAR|nr:uncharacterized protein E1B28_008971 [Marasmius oreades]KAG7092628.1 hypothetical protein E1B28_008971 [Marasmius oreades]
MSRFDLEELDKPRVYFHDIDLEFCNDFLDFIANIRRMVINKKAVLLNVLRLLLADWAVEHPGISSQADPIWLTLENDLNKYLLTTRFPTLNFAPVEDRDAWGWQPMRVEQLKQEEEGSPDPHHVFIRLDLAVGLNNLIIEVQTNPLVKTHLTDAKMMMVATIVHELGHNLVTNLLPCVHWTPKRFRQNNMQPHNGESGVYLEEIFFGGVMAGIFYKEAGLDLSKIRRLQVYNMEVWYCLDGENRNILEQFLENIDFRTIPVNAEAPLFKGFGTSTEPPTCPPAPPLHNIETWKHGCQHVDMSAPHSVASSIRVDAENLIGLGINGIQGLEEGESRSYITNCFQD